jgi:hypothetical protein
VRRDERHLHHIRHLIKARVVKMADIHDHPHVLSRSDKLSSKFGKSALKLRGVGRVKAASVSRIIPARPSEPDKSHSEIIKCPQQQYVVPKRFGTFEGEEDADLPRFRCSPRLCGIPAQNKMLSRLLSSSFNAEIWSARCGGTLRKYSSHMYSEQ